jgi:hypothetical protein
MQIVLYCERNPHKERPAWQAGYIPFYRDLILEVEQSDIRGLIKMEYRRKKEGARTSLKPGVVDGLKGRKGQILAP